MSTITSPGGTEVSVGTTSFKGASTPAPAQPCRGPRRIRRRRAAKLTTVLVLGALLTLAVTPIADAQGLSTKQDIYGCFTWAANAPYAAENVSLQLWNSSTRKWQTQRTTTTTSSGCVRFNDLAVGYYYRLDGYKFIQYGDFPVHCYYWDGVSPFIGPTQANDYLYRLPVTYVYGPYAIC